MFTRLKSGVPCQKSWRHGTDILGCRADLFTRVNGVLRIISMRASCCLYFASLFNERTKKVLILYTCISINSARYVLNS